MGKGSVDLSFSLTTAEPDSFLVPASITGPLPAAVMGSAQIDFEIGPNPANRDVAFTALKVEILPPVANLRASLLLDAVTLAPGGRKANKVILETDGPLPSGVGFTVKVSGTEA